MSDPTYRIDTEHRPWESPAIRWVATVTRLSDDQFVASVHRETEGYAIEEAAQWVAAQSTQQSGRSVYVDDDGRPVEGHSVKA